MSRIWTSKCKSSRRAPKRTGTNGRNIFMDAVHFMSARGVIAGVGYYGRKQFSDGTSEISGSAPSAALGFVSDYAAGRWAGHMTRFAARVFGFEVTAAATIIDYAVDRPDFRLFDYVRDFARSGPAADGSFIG